MTRTKRILLTGASGQVGFELQRQLCLHGDIEAPTRQQLDLADPAAVEKWLGERKPDLIVNAAAYTAVDKAEEESDLARRLNAELPAQLAAYCAEQGASLVHYSSDYVYPGSGTTAWSETSANGPLSVYGQTKLEGDQAIMTSGCQHLIFRTSWVYSARGNNFMKTMLRLGRERETLSIVADQVGAPTPARLISQVTAMGLSREISSGLYHLAPRGETSWHGFAEAIFQMAKARGEALVIDQARLAGIPTADYPTPATRPLNSRLELSKLEKALQIKLPEWQSQLALTLSEYLEP